MTYSELRAAFTAILNRRDITPSLITTFINLGIQNLQRKLRLPAMEEMLEFSTSGNEVPIPVDYLELISLYVDDTTNGRRKLERKDLETVLKASATVGQPLYFCRVNSFFLIGPVPPAASTLYVNYYKGASDLSADDDTNWMTLAIPSLVIYSSLKYAADHYLDDRKMLWAQTLKEELEDVKDGATTDELIGATMSPVYPDQNEAL